MTDHCDVILTDTGAGGDTLAYKLAGSGKRILLLERSNFLPREKENWDARTVFAEGKDTTTVDSQRVRVIKLMLCSNWKTLSKVLAVSEK